MYIILYKYFFQDFQSAETAFQQVLKLDPNCQEAINDLFFIQVKKLMDMGFSKKKATSALHRMKTLNVCFSFNLFENIDLFIILLNVLKYTLQ